MTNIDVGERKALRDEVLLTTVRKEVPAGGHLHLVLEVDPDASHDFFVEIANGSAKQTAHFEVSDNVDFTGGTPVPISTSVVDGNLYGGDDITAYTDLTVNSDDTRYQMEISGGSDLKTGAAGEGRFTQALLSAGQTYGVHVHDDSGTNNWSTINIRIWKINGAN